MSKVRIGAISFLLAVSMLACLGGERVVSSNGSNDSSEPDQQDSDDSDDSEVSASGTKADLHDTREDFYNNRDELRCECFWEVLSPPGDEDFESAEDCTSFLVTEEDKIDERASCLQSLLQDFSDVPPKATEYFECSEKEYSDAQSCLSDLSDEFSCSDLTQDQIQSCETYPSGSINHDCRDIDDSTDEWLFDFHDEAFTECPE